LDAGQFVAGIGHGPSALMGNYFVATLLHCEHTVLVQ
jgi:hypothetical protein